MCVSKTRHKALPKLPPVPAFKHGGRVKAMPSTMKHQGVPHKRGGK